jgi:hypothetical protein
MGDENKVTPKEETISVDTDKLSAALGVDILEDESNTVPSKNEELDEKSEEKETDKLIEKEEKETVIDEESLKTELTDLRKLKGRLGEELGLKKKEVDYYRTQYENLISKKPEEKKETEDKFAKLTTVTDPTEYVKEVVRLASEEAETRAKSIVDEANAKLVLQTTVWNDLVKDYPELADKNSPMYIQTDALMKVNEIGLQNSKLAKVAAELVKSQLRLAEVEKEKLEVVEKGKKKKIEKVRQGGIGGQPAQKSVSSPKWDSMSNDEKKLATSLGLSSKDYEEE